jgi:hypothetical protein
MMQRAVSLRLIMFGISILQYVTVHPLYDTSTDTKQRFPDVAWFRNHPFPLYDDLAYLLEGVLATGVNAVTAGGRTTTPTTGPAGDGAQASVDDDNDNADNADTARETSPQISDDDEAGTSSPVKLGKVGTAQSHLYFVLKTIITARALVPGCRSRSRWPSQTSPRVERVCNAEACRVRGCSRC